MAKRIWKTIFCSHKLNTLSTALLKTKFAWASSDVIDDNLPNYLAFLLYACPVYLCAFGRVKLEVFLYIAKFCLFLQNKVWGVFN